MPRRAQPNRKSFMMELRDTRITVSVLIRLSEFADHLIKLKESGKHDVSLTKQSNWGWAYERLEKSK